MSNTDWDWFRLCNISGIGILSVEALLNYAGDIDGIFKMSPKELENVVDFRAKGFMEENIDETKRRYDRCVKDNIHFVHLEHKDYPKRFNLLYDKPVGFYYYGTLPDDKLSIAIIGARQAGNYGLEMARYFGRELAKNGVNVISGLAFGADSMGHKGALEGGGYTLGILGCGINICYPKENYDIFMQMKEKGGIISESGLDVKPSARLFPHRNRLIAALADGILVTEARDKSGTLITVDQGLELGKDIFAIPGRNGDPLSSGCNKLIQNGAKLTASVDDILDEYRQLDKDPDDIVLHKNVDLTDDERFIYNMLSLEETFIEDILDKSHMPAGNVISILMNLCAKNLVKQNEHNYYSVVI